MTFWARAVRIVTGARSGMLTIWSSIGETSVCVVPQISTISAVMRSRCSVVVAKSTPRSKRCAASVEKLKRRARPWIAFGHQNAASR
jgi:hypothetical protein